MSFEAVTILVLIVPLSLAGRCLSGNEPFLRLHAPRRRLALPPQIEDMELAAAGPRRAVYTGRGEGHRRDGPLQPYHAHDRLLRRVVEDERRVGRARRQ